MDDEAELGIIFTLGIAFGLVAMWLVLTARGRQTAKQVLEVAEDLADELSEQAGELVEQASDVAGDLRHRFG
jgi:hypothetical protein